MISKLKRRARVRAMISASVAAVGVLGGPLRADLNWDPNAAPGVQGGTGVWDLSTSNWTSDNGATNTLWNSTGAIFGGATGGTVTIDNGGTGISATTLTFNITGDAS